MRGKLLQMVGEPDFPVVELVEEISHPQHPLGRYVPEKKLIELSAKELQGRTMGERRFAIYHELGHWWRVTMVPDKQLPKSTAKKLSAEEDFADAFACFCLSPDELDPKTKKYFQSSVDTEEVCKFAEDIFFEVNSALR